jgi:hypothetical protein
MTTKSFRDLHVWSRGIELTEAIYRVTATFPKQEMYGLSSQLQRAAVSVPANIAEGTDEIRRGSTCTTCPTRWDRLPNWKHSSKSRCDLSTSHRPQGARLSRRRPHSAK